ncbi:aminotransferase class V-fold PLP-dependent enzyme [Algoriphagus zhangzhouensis]|uniref:Selenocysteine lyase/Cysteine desulfurase n=1 Tax=Algoriphagus zhangzhouensis TaxID=1073327 RepID=A0A1M7Z3Z4_9BACT|nr:aminotransferase class V-fold PLP-dependent enzyme [Algoriphagus zhangzhouensis]TDY48443.1 selenocysteine lyase/cysteine desulfurase [Algoriphagus zhangzhouensis]SHO59490.1 Selenocysteine lyase/Cysteine desulfurase [Algoriphagus zhangzhouensis]
MNNRRNFLKKGILAAAASSTFATPGISMETRKEKDVWKELPLIEEDDFLWDWVRNEYSVSSTIANLNNGSVSPQPKVVQEVFEHYTREFNTIPSMYMWSKGDISNAVREQLAELAGCSPEEIAVNRNTTEAINTVIWGMNYQKGDEIILCEQDYTSVMNTWQEVEARYGVTLKWLSFDLPVEDDDVIVEAYKNAVTDKTKVVTITHVNNINGNILPVRKISDSVKSVNPKVKVLVDGAHSFGHINFKIPELGCDFYGTSLHKWLCAPFGTGMLYVKKSEIQELWPLFTHANPQSDNINKFSTFGTRNLPAELSIARAIQFHNVIGIQRKEERLRFLKNYWVERVIDIPNVEIKTSMKPEFACALASFSLKNMPDGEVAQKLLKEYHIHVTQKGDKTGKFHGMRVTPHVYTTTQELDRFVRGIINLAKS